MGALRTLKPGLSDGAYGMGGRAAIGVLSAFGPVGMLAGKLFGDVLFEASPLPLRGPSGGGGGGGSALEDVSLEEYKGSGALENDGDTLALRAACGAVGGCRGLVAGPCGGDFAGAEGAVGGGPWRDG